MTNFDQPISELDPIRREGLDWIIHLTSGTATAADAEAIRRWRARSPAHEAAFVEAARLRRALRIAGHEFSGGRKSIASAREFLQQRYRPSTPTATRSAAVGRRAFLGGSAAAAAGVAGYCLLANPVLGLWPSLAELNADYRTGTGERNKVALANDVSLELNTQTSIGVRSTADGQQIELISGEAAVATQSPALLVAGPGRIRARDAKFNIRRDGSSVCVTCLQGEVNVGHQAREVRLQANDQVAYTDTLGVPVAVDPTLVQAWQQGLLIFHEESLNHVLAEVNRYRRGRIVLANTELGRRRMNGVFHLDRLDGIVDQLRKLGATVTSAPGGLVILS
jgi:transmembrane sensor